MMVLIQLLKMFNCGESRDGILSWCESIERDQSEAYEFREYLDDLYGIEFSDSQFDRFVVICLNGRYISAFKVVGSL